MKRIFAVLMVLCAAGSVWAVGLDPIPQESGLDGYINLGAAYMDIESNEFAGNKFMTLTADRTDSVLTSPDSEENIAPMITGEFRYTFADSRTQLFLGNSLEDFLQFDRSSAFGVRQELSNESIVEGSFLFSAMPTKVWSDPFLTGANRLDTDRDSAGVRLAWGRLFGTSLQVQYSYRDIDVDKENSGVDLGLSAADQALLNRDGDQHRGEVMYTFKMNDNNWLAPKLSFTSDDRDGDAMAANKYGVLLTHVYGSQKFKLVTNLNYAWCDYDSSHPVYTRTRDDDQYGITSTAFFPNFLNNENLTGNVGVAYFYQDSNIAFYDSEILMISAGTMYTF
ncbi:MAG: DUF2860 family protein [Planctomycetota bacterium]|jgi:hypothetical protein